MEIFFVPKTVKKAPSGIEECGFLSYFGVFWFGEGFFGVCVNNFL